MSGRQQFWRRISLPLALFCSCSLFSVRHVLPSADAVESHVQQVGGLPTLVIETQPHSGFCYSTYDTSSPNLEHRAAQFAAAGCDIFNFVVEISGYGYSHPLWPQRDRWDFSDLDDRAHRIIAAAPRARLWPRIYVDAPAWWREENPQEMMLLGNGSTSFGEKLFALSRPGDYPSLASEKWRADMRFALRTIVEHIEEADYADRIVGYQLSGQKTEEWYHWSMNCPLLGDYSAPMQRAFRSWLRKRYGGNKALREAWQQPGVTLETAEIPSQQDRIGDRSRTFRQIPREQPVIDFHSFWSDIMADTIEVFAKAVKDAVHEPKVVGAFYAYTFEFADLAEDAGHLALHKLLRSPHIDFIMAPSSYYNRNLPGTPFFRAPVKSIALHGKLFWNDFDQVSYKYFDKLKENPNLKTWEYQMGLSRTPEEFVWMNCREIGMTLASGVQTANFDIHGGYYDDPVIMEGVRRLGKIRAESLDRPDRTSHAEILLLVDEDSQHYLHFRNPAEQPGTLLRSLLSGQIAEMGMVAPYDAALLSDLDQLDTRSYKLALVLDAFRLDRAQRQTVRRRLAGLGRTVIWFYAPGYFDQDGSDPKNIAQVTGIRVVPGVPRAGPAKAVLRGDLAGLVKDLPLIDAEPFVVEDETAEVLATRSDDAGQVVLARRCLGDWTSIYTAAAPLPAAFLKQIAAAAGVHIYDWDPSHLLFANRNYIMLAADERGGEAEIHLPAPARVTDAMSDQQLGEQVRGFQVLLRPKEVRLFLLQ